MGREPPVIVPLDGAAGVAGGFFALGARSLCGVGAIGPGVIVRSRGLRGGYGFHDGGRPGLRFG